MCQRVFPHLPNSCQHDSVKNGEDSARKATLHKDEGDDRGQGTVATKKPLAHTRNTIETAFPSRAI